MPGGKRKPGNDVGTDQDPTSRRTQRKAARTDDRADAPTAVNGEDFSFSKVMCFADAVAAARQDAAPAVHNLMASAGDPAV
jgi:hypothetical protein